MSKDYASAYSKSEELILVINAGSSSLKYKVFRDEVEILAGIMEGVGKEGRSTITIRGVSKTVETQTRNHADAVRDALHIISQHVPIEKVIAVLHRVVHGGEHFTQHAVITASVESIIDELCQLAPLHNPANLAGIRAARRELPNAVHIACFDTVFHHTIPKHAFIYGIPYVFYEKYGIRKYGFHGLSHQYLSQRVYEITGRSDRIITCHLGSGSSICAIHHGKSLDTTMGFSPLDGLLMATRSGEIDPEIPLFIMEHERLSTTQMMELLNKEAGLKGLTGVSDLREVKKLADAGDEHAKLAIAMLCYRIASAIGNYHITVGGVHTIVFTGGIGEHAAFVRERVGELLSPIGVLLDKAANNANRETISADSSRVNVLVVPANEELQMVRLYLSGSYTHEPHHDTYSHTN